MLKRIPYPKMEEAWFLVRRFYKFKIKNEITKQYKTYLLIYLKLLIIREGNIN